MYFVPTKDIERLQKPQGLSMGWNDCSSSISALTPHRRGDQVRTFMSTMLVIQKRVTGNMLQVILIFLQKKEEEIKALKLYKKSLNVLLILLKKPKEERNHCIKVSFMITNYLTISYISFSFYTVSN